MLKLLTETRFFTAEEQSDLCQRLDDTGRHGFEMGSDKPLNNKATTVLKAWELLGDAQCKCPSDRVFGLLALMGDGASDIVAPYTQDAAEAFRKATYAAMLGDKSLEPLIHAAYNQRNSEIPDLPHWSMDFTDPVSFRFGIENNADLPSLPQMRLDVDAKALAISLRIFERIHKSTNRTPMGDDPRPQQRELQAADYASFQKHGFTVQPALPYASVRQGGSPETYGFETYVKEKKGQISDFQTDLGFVGLGLGTCRAGDVLAPLEKSMFFFVLRKVDKGPRGYRFVVIAHIPEVRFVFGTAESAPQEEEIFIY